MKLSEDHKKYLLEIVNSYEWEDKNHLLREIKKHLFHMSDSVRNTRLLYMHLVHKSPIKDLADRYCLSEGMIKLAVTNIILEYQHSKRSYETVKQFENKHLSCFSLEDKNALIKEINLKLLNDVENEEIENE